MMGGAFMGAMMAQQGGGGWVNPYVTDGLIAMWDGEWNAGGGVHDANATTWTDLAGNRNATITTFGHVRDHYLECDGVGADSYAAVCDPFANGSIATLESVFYIVTKPSGNTTVFMSGEYASSILLANVGYRVQNTEIPQIIGYRKLYSDSSIRDMRQISWSVGDDGLSINGVSQSSVGTNSIDKTTARGTGCYFGGTKQYGIKCHIYSVRCYDRALTASEIAANYAVDRARFNLP